MVYICIYIYMYIYIYIYIHTCLRVLSSRSSSSLAGIASTSTLSGDKDALDAPARTWSTLKLRTREGDGDLLRERAADD